MRKVLYFLLITSVIISLFCMFIAVTTQAGEYIEFDDTQYIFNEESPPDIKGDIFPTLYEVFPTEYKCPYLSSVKDQGNEGLCTIYATLSVIEAAGLKEELGEYDLDEHSLADYIKPGERENRYQGGFGITEPIQPIMQQKYPTEENEEEKPFLIDNIRIIDITDKSTAKQAILEGGFVASIDMSSARLNARHEENYYYSYPHIYKSPDDEAVARQGHAVHIIGWDDNFSGDNFHNNPGDGAWIFKNSWGTDWGYSGYGYISYNDISLSNIGITYSVQKRPENISINIIEGIETKNDIASGLYTSKTETAEHIIKVGAFFGNTGDYFIKCKEGKKITSEKEITTQRGFILSDISDKTTLFSTEDLLLEIDGDDINLSYTDIKEQIIVITEPTEQDGLNHIVLVKGQTVNIKPEAKIFSKKGLAVKKGKIKGEKSGVYYIYEAKKKKGKHIKDYKITVKEPEILCKKRYLTTGLQEDIKDYIKDIGIKPYFISSKPEIIDVDNEGICDFKKKGKATVYIVYGADNIKDKKGTGKKYKIKYIVN